MDTDLLDYEYLKSLRLLYVEDEEDAHAQYSQFLKRLSGILITAKNGAEGLEAFKKHAPDIVVTDIMMPEMDGLTMAQEIREIEPSVPIIIITAFEQTVFLRDAINSGINRYITKPVNSYQLFECLQECVRHLKADQQLKLVMANWPR